MNCPHCGKEILDDHLATEIARVLAKRRKKFRRLDHEEAVRIGRKGGLATKAKRAQLKLPLDTIG